MYSRHSLISEDLNYELHGFLWHGYPEMLQRLGFNRDTARMLISDALENTRWWLPAYQCKLT